MDITVKVGDHKEWHGGRILHSPTASQYFAGRNKVRGRVQEREEGNRLAKILFFFAERMVVRKV